MYDLLIKNAKIIDGTGSPAVDGTVASLNGKLHILPVGDTSDAKEVIDGAGLIVSPGFVDVHSHGDVPLGKEFSSVSKVSQGITTQIAGQCGFSMFPVNPKTMHLMQEGMAIFTDDFPKEMETFTSFENYLKYANKIKLPENVKFLTGHVSLRIAAMGFDNRAATPAELEHMKSMLRESLENGSMGLCTGLIYIPSAFSDVEEIAELCKVVAEYDGVYTTHMRNESNEIAKSVAESIDVGRRSGCKVHISHLKICGKPHWGGAKDILKMIEDAQKEGVKVSVDQYPYTASMTHLSASVPPKYFTNGISGMVEFLKNPELREVIKKEIMDPNEPFENQYVNCDGFDNIFISKCAATPQYEGMTIGDSARKFDKDGFDVFFEILIENKGIATAIYFCMCDEDVFEIISFKDTMPGTDGIVKSEFDRAHPRAYGTMPRAIDYFTKRNKVLPLEKMIYKMTALPAEKFQLKGKGIIADGMDADLVVFNPETVCDTADFLDSNKKSDGIEYVIVAGEVIYKDKQLTGATPGKVILHNK